MAITAYNHGLAGVRRHLTSDELLADLAKGGMTMVIAEILVEPGQSVDSGTLLVRLAEQDLSDADAQALRAKLAFEQALAAGTEAVPVMVEVLGQRVERSLRPIRGIHAHLDDPSGRNADLFALMEYDPSQLDDTCKTEFAELAGVVPRIVMGYTDVGERHMAGAMIVELREDIAAGLATLPAAVPGLGRDPGGLFSFGFSLDPMALRTFYEARLDAMEKAPFQCAALAELQASTAQGRQALAQPLPPVVYNFRGMMATIEDVEGFDMSTTQPPESIDAGIFFVVENAQDLVNMAALMSPQVAALNLLPDGKSRRLDLPELGEMAEKAFAALSNSGLSISVGDGAEQKAEAMLEADIERTSPLMSVSVDAKRYYEFVGQAMMQADEPEEGDPTPIEVREAMRDVVLSSGSIYERMLTRVYLTSRGIEVATRMTLAR